jgi:hypothetical protein
MKQITRRAVLGGLAAGGVSMSVLGDRGAATTALSFAANDVAVESRTGELARVVAEPDIQVAWSNVTPDQIRLRIGVGDGSTWTTVQQRRESVGTSPWDGVLATIPLYDRDPGTAAPDVSVFGAPDGGSAETTRQIRVRVALLDASGATIVSTSEARSFTVTVSDGGQASVQVGGRARITAVPASETATATATATETATAKGYGSGGFGERTYG